MYVLSVIRIRNAIHLRIALYATRIDMIEKRNLSVFFKMYQYISTALVLPYAASMVQIS